MANNPHVFLGAGINYASASAIRIGYGDLEIGQFSNAVYTVNKIFKMDNIYTLLGLGLSYDSQGVVAASFGWVSRDYLKFAIRGELTAVQGTKGYSEGKGTLGVSWGFK